MDILHKEHPMGHSLMQSANSILSSEPSSETSNSIDIALSQDVLLAQKGSIEAYERLIAKCQNVVTSIALAIVKDVDDSEEVAQQVFISVWQNLKKLKSSTSFLPWVRQSTRYTAFNFLRDNKSSSKVDSDAADTILAHLSDPQVNHDEQLVLENRDAVLHAFIDKLESEEREIVLLYYREEQSSQQVADLLNLSSANVRKKLSRVRESLKIDLLKSVGSCIYSTAPAIGFSAFVASLVVPAAPAAAASIVASTASASGKASSSLVVKFAAIIGGAMIGAFIAVLAVVWSSNMAIKRMPDVNDKVLLKQYRNETVAWVLLWGVLIALAYSFTAGWIGPVLTYLGFSLGLIALMYRSMALIHSKSVNKCARTGKVKPASKALKYFSYVCLWLGPSVGFIGMLIGLINRGRLVF